MKTKTEKLLAVMNVLAWITFIGLMIKAGIFLLNFVIDMFNPEAAKNVYMGLDLYGLRRFSAVHYSITMLLTILLLTLEAYIAYLVIKVLSKIKLASPFTAEVSGALEKLSYYILGTWVTAMLYDAHTIWVLKELPALQLKIIPGEFIFLGGVVFVIAQIFKKGVEIQSENELTV